MDQNYRFQIGETLPEVVSVAIGYFINYWLGLRTDAVSMIDQPINYNV